MNTDHQIYQYLSIGQEALHTLTGVVLHGPYTFSAPVLKTTERRIDALFTPQGHDGPVYVIEFQAQPKSTAWYNLLTKMSLYGEENPKHKVKGILIFPNANLDSEPDNWVIQNAPGLLSAVYLDSFWPQLFTEQADNPFVAVLAPLMIENDEELQHQAPKLWHTVHEAKLPEATRTVLEQILETWFLERFKNCTEHEVLDMLQSLTPLEETRAYKSIFAKGMAKGIIEGKAEGKAEGEAEGEAKALMRLLERRFKKIPKKTQNLIATADVVTLEKWFDRAIDATSLTEVFE